MDAALLLTAALSLWENLWNEWVEDGYVTRRSYQVVATDEYGRRVVHFHAFDDVEDAGRFLEKIKASGKTYKDFEASDHWTSIEPVYGSLAYCEWEHGYYDDEEREAIMRNGGPRPEVLVSGLDKLGIKA